jgi:hypothetical protein
MNDVLSPSFRADDADFDAWSTRYRALIAALRERTSPRLIALATVPLCTEDEQSPKNQAIASLMQRLNTVAREEKAVVLPVHEAMLEMLGEGRTLNADFHVTADFVHPNGAGHLAIAQGMLKGLGEAGAAQKLSDKYADKIWNRKAKVGSRSSGGNDYLAVWTHGESVYGGYIMREGGKIIDSTLHKGWNSLVFKSNHLQWQWHLSI